MKNLVDCVSVPCCLPEAEAREIDALVKTLPSGCDYVRKAYVSEMQFEPNERAEVSIVSTSAVDESNEVVIPKGVNFDTFRKSGTIFWEHKKDKPVATCAWIKTYGEDQIRAKSVYPERPSDIGEKDWYVDYVWGLTKCHPAVLKCKSIGILPLTPMREPTADELQLHPDWAGAGIRDNCRLLEYSCCASGVNTEALVLEVNNKSMSCAILKSLGFDVQEPVAEIVAAVPSMTEQEAIAFALQHGDWKPKGVKKSLDYEAIMAQAIEKLDIESIVQKAIQTYRNRGRV